MQVQPTRRSNLFLLELILAILFFSLAATICVQYFVKSHTMEMNSAERNYAVNCAATVAEVLRSSDEPLNALEDYFPDGEAEGNLYYIYYDKNWQPAKSDDSAYLLTLNLSEKNAMLTGDIDITKEDVSIYSLSVKKYLGREDISHED